MTKTANNDERMNGALQENVLTLLCFDTDSAKTIRASVSPELFESRVYRDIASHAIGFLDQYGTAISDHLPDMLEGMLSGDDKRRATLYKRTLENLYASRAGVNSKYIIDRLSEFIHLQSLQGAMLSAYDKVEAGKIAEADKILDERHRLSGADELDLHRNAPKPDDKAFHGLVGRVARAGSDHTEAPPVAIALNFMTWLGVAVGRRPFMWIADTAHHTIIHAAHVGRSGEGRKGDSTQLVKRIDDALRKLTGDAPIGALFPYPHAPQRHTGGLSSREGLVKAIADPPDTDADDADDAPSAPGRDRAGLAGLFDDPTPSPTPAKSLDKRLWVVESEFANVLKQAKREGNTLSAALRDAFDGQALKPLTKSAPIGVERPHVGLSVGITPTELRYLLPATDISNGFMNRFLLVHAERGKLVSFPAPTDIDVVKAFAEEVKGIIDWVHDRSHDRGEEDDPTENQLEIRFSRDAKLHYDKLYRGELSQPLPGQHIAALLVRRATYIHRLAMLFAITDRSTYIEIVHVEAALAWVRLWADSIKFVFATDKAEVEAQETSTAAIKVLEFLQTQGRASRTDLVSQCFRGHASKTRIDTALDELLHSTPPRIVVTSVPRTTGPGSATKFYEVLK